MTECERLIKEGTLPAEFLKPEMRECYVPVEMKKLWALQIDLIQQVKKIADRHNLTFFAAGGSAIGAVRHKGFIPWDDDMDIMLKREDFNAFIEYAKKELPEPYFLQIPSTDQYFYRPFAALRNSNSTCIARGYSHSKCNNGAVIHILPLDGYTNNSKCNNFIKVQKLKNRAAVSRSRQSMRENKIIKSINKFIAPIIVGGSNAQNYVRHEKACTVISKQNHDHVGIQYSFFVGDISKLVWHKRVFDSVIMMPFEYTEIPVPVGYDEMLTVEFGNYMELPSEENRVNKHAFEIDPDTPYKEYCAKKYGTKYDT